MPSVRQRKRKMVDGLIEVHLANYKASGGAELIMGSGRFVGPKTIEVSAADRTKRLVRGKHVLINTGTRARIDSTPGLRRRESNDPHRSFGVGSDSGTSPRYRRRLRRPRIITSDATLWQPGHGP